MVSTSIPEKPKALSPSIAITGSPLTTAAATAKPMPTPMMPQVPTSRRLRGLYMSTMLRVKSSALAPSLTRHASGLALTMSRTTFSALWKFIGIGFLARVSASFAMFLFLRSATAGSRSALRMRIRQQPLGHGHGQVRDARLLDEGTDLRVGLRIGRAFAEDNQRLLRALQQVERALDGFRRRNLLGRWIHHLDQGPFPELRIEGLREQLRRQVEVHAARAAGDGGADGARDAHTDVLGVQHAEGGLGERSGDGQLVHLFVVALLQVDDLALAGAADEDHREAIGGGVGQCGQAVEEAGGGNRQADARLLRHEAGDGGGVACVLLMAERNHAHACGLCHAGEVGDRDTGQTEDRVDAVELEGIDDEVKAVGYIL